MPRFRDLPIRRKLVAVMVATSFVVVALAVVGQAVMDSAVLRGQLREQLRMAARIVGMNSEAALRFGDATAAHEALVALRHDPSIVAAALYTPDGRMLASLADPAHRPLPRTAGASGWAPPRGTWQTTEEVWRDGELVGTVLVRADDRRFLQRLRLVAFVALGLLACAVVLSALLATRLQAVISQPIMALAAATRRISEHRDYRLRVERSGRDEVGELIDGFNGMLAEIERRDTDLRAANESLDRRVRERTADADAARQQAVEQAEALQLQAVDLQEARDAALASAKAKGAFLANMSHEIRTPLHGVIGMVDLLSRTPLTEEQGECVRTIHTSAESLLAILNDILDYSRIEAGRMQIESAPFDPAQVVEEVAEVQAAQGHARRLEVQCFADPRLPSRVIGDPTRVRQTLANLVGNAVKFTAEGGVWVEAALVEEAAERVLVRFIVTDTGVGIPERARDAIFGSFMQADESMTRRFGGTGLGLPIAHSLSEAMGGRLWLEESSERGSTFVAEIPFALPADARAPAARAVSEARVLLVHRHAAGWCAVERLLRAWGCSVTEATGAQQAEAALRAASVPPHGVVVELGADAAAAAAAVRAARAACPGAFVVSVGVIGERDGAADAAHARLTQPVRRDALRAAVMAACDRSTTQSARPAATPLPVRAPDGPPLRVLVVDDNAVNRKVAARMLERLSCEVATAADGEEALSATAAGGFDLVLMDMQMPVMDGVSATRAIRERERATGCRLTIIAVTANAMAADRDACLEAGMDGHLAKPVTMQQLAELLSHLDAGGPVSRRQAA